MRVFKNEKECTIQFVSSSDNGLNLKLSYRFYKGTVLYKVFSVNKFLSDYLGIDVKFLDERIFLLPNLYREFEDGTYGTDICVKHVFSSIVGVHCLDANKRIRFSDESFVKFLNFFLKNDFNSSILPENSKMYKPCNFCTRFGFQSEKFDDVDGSISKCLENYLTLQGQRITLMVGGQQYIEPKYFDSKYLAMLLVLLRKAGQEIRVLLNVDHTIASKTWISNLGLNLVNYDPAVDYMDFTSPLIKTFIETLCTGNFSYLGRVVLRDCLLVAGHCANYPLKPLSNQFLGIVVTYTEDDAKRLDVLCRIGVTTSYKTTSAKVTSSSIEYNKVYHNIPLDANINAVGDNGQADIGSKNWNAFKEHHVDSLNVLQVVYPNGNESLSKQPSKTISDLDSNFVLPSVAETMAKGTFQELFIHQTIELAKLTPAIPKTPSISDVIPINVRPKEEMVSEYCLKVYHGKGNVLKASLLKLPENIVCNAAHPDDETIRWDNSCGNKTCLRHIVIGKSTSETVFLEMLQVLYDIYYNPQRPKIFLTLDQALYDFYFILDSKGKISLKFKNFFILLLDSFHLQWTMLKCLFSAFDSAGLRDFFTIIGIDDASWIGIKGVAAVTCTFMILN